MNKQQVQQRVLQNGKPLSLDKFSWDEKTKVFSSNENHLVLDFSGVDSCTFKTGSDCTFDTGSDCVFNTGYDCTFDTGSYCTFKTANDCTFDTGSDCTFDTSHDCTFKTGSDCTFTVGKECVIVRRDIFEIIQPKTDVKIKLNEYEVKGYTVIEETKTITIDNKNIEISIESFNKLKKQLINGIMMMKY